MAGIQSASSCCSTMRFADALTGASPIGFGSGGGVRRRLFEARAGVRRALLSVAVGRGREVAATRLARSECKQR